MHRSRRRSITVRRAMPNSHARNLEPSRSRGIPLMTYPHVLQDLSRRLVVTGEPTHESPTAGRATG